MRLKAAGYLVGTIFGALLAALNAHHLREPSISWMIRFSSVAWGTIALVSFLSFIDEIRKRSSGL